MLKKQELCLSLQRNLRDTYTRLIFPPFFYEAQANKTTQKNIDSVIQSEMMHSSVRIPACTSAAGRAPLPAQQGKDCPFNVCLLRSRGLCLTHRAGRWKMVHIPTGTSAWCCGISTSEQQAGQWGHVHHFLVLCSSLEVFKIHSITLNLSLPMQSLILP